MYLAKQLGTEWWPVVGAPDEHVAEGRAELGLRHQPIERAVALRDFRRGLGRGLEVFAVDEHAA